MSDGINLTKISAIVHLSNDLPYPLSGFYNILRSILQQYEHSLELIILDQVRDDKIAFEVSRMNTEGNNIVFIKEPFSTLGAWLNAGRASPLRKGSQQVVFGTVLGPGGRDEVSYEWH